MTSPKQEGAFKRLVRSLSRSSPRSERPQVQQRSSSRGKRLDDIAKYAPASNGVAIPHDLPSPQGVAYSTSPPPGESSRRVRRAVVLAHFASSRTGLSAELPARRGLSVECGRRARRRRRQSVAVQVGRDRSLAAEQAAALAFAAASQSSYETDLRFSPRFADSYFPRPPSEVLIDSEANGQERHPDSIGARCASSSITSLSLNNPDPIVRAALSTSANRPRAWPRRA